MARVLFLEMLFCSVCTMGVILLFIVCGIVLFLRRNEESDRLKYAAGIFMGIGFIILLFVLWYMMTLSDNVSEVNSMPNGYYEFMDNAAKRELRREAERERTYFDLTALKSEGGERKCMIL